MLVAAVVVAGDVPEVSIAFAAVAMPGRPLSTFWVVGDGSCPPVPSLGLLIGYPDNSVAAALGDVSCALDCSPFTLASSFTFLFGLLFCGRLAKAAAPVSFICGARVGSFEMWLCAMVWAAFGDIGGAGLEVVGARTEVVAGGRDTS